MKITEEEFITYFNLLCSVQIRTMDKYTAKKYIKECYEHLLPAERTERYEELAQLKKIEDELFTN